VPRAIVWGELYFVLSGHVSRSLEGTLLDDGEMSSPGG
jgi:hypothetical protein